MMEKKVIQMSKREEFGVCDECGEYTEELVLIDRAWICRICSKMA